MNVQWPFVGVGAQGWTAVDASDGGYCAVSVRPGRSGKPQVMSCAHSAAESTGLVGIREVATKLGSLRDPCTVVLSRGEYQMLVVPEPPVLESEMQSNLRWSLASVVDYPLDDANIDWMRIPTAAFQPASDKQVYAVVTRNSMVVERTGMLEKAGFRVKAVDVRETSLRNIAVLLEKRVEGLGLLTVGPGGVTTTFTFRGELYLDRFISQPMDEILEGDSQKQQKFFDRVSQQVYQSMELITRTHPFITIERIVLGPVPADLALGTHLAGKLPVPVQLLDLASIFDLSAVPQLRKPENQLRYLVALGAALRGQRNKS